MENLKSNLIQHMEALCLKCGSRHNGSEGERMAVDYMVDYLSGLGLPVVCEEYPSRGWNFESFEFYNVTKGEPIAKGSACFFSGSVDWEGKLMFIEASQVDNLADLPVAGQVCFIKYIHGVFTHNRIAQELENLGAAAVIIVSPGLGADTKVVRNYRLQRIAVATTDARGAYQILDNPNDTYRLKIKANAFDYISKNVIVRLGNGKKKGVIGSHYDTAPLVQGATDNASGVATVMELARLMKDADLDMTLDFAAFSGEEYLVEYPDYKEPAGSGAYLKRHGKEDIRWFLNNDGAGDNFSRRIMRTGYPEKLPPIEHNFPAEDHALDGGDNVPFSRVGIPSVWQIYAQYLPVLHTSMDSLDHIDYDLLTEATVNAYDILQQLIEGTI